jgi:hypothetical protein
MELLIMRRVLKMAEIDNIGAAFWQNRSTEVVPLFRTGG